ncbi:MAG: Crp/Fnr family transcriptional regulator [Chitinophagaceae bacterium]
MSKESLIHFIGNNLLAGQQSAAADLASNFSERQLTKGEYFLKEGQLANEYLFLEEGCIRAYTTDTEGNDVTTGFYIKEQVVFEVSSFFSRTRSKENLQALTGCKGYSLTYPQLNELFHAVPAFREFGRAMLVKGFVNLKERTLSLINETAEERYAGLINANPEIFQFAPLKYIASYLGVTDSSLSRIRKEFQKK